MKTAMKRLFVAIIVGLLGSYSSGQAQESETGSRRPAAPPAFIQELPDRFGVLVAADVNRDRRLDVDELAELAAALEDGTIERPHGLPKVPVGVAIPYDMIALKLGELYQALAPYDADLNGELSEEERFAIFSAIISGELEPPFLQFRGERGSVEGRFRGRRNGRPFRGRGR